MTKTSCAAASGIGVVCVLLTAQVSRKPFRAQSSSTIDFGVKGSEETVEIQNAAYELTGDSVPGRPAGERLVLRKTARSKQIVGDKGSEAEVTVEAWPLGADVRQKPVYKISIEGVGARTAGNAVLVVDRGVEEVMWWSVYRLGDGRKLFDTYVPLLEFSITNDVQTPRYVGYEAPPDDTADARLREPQVVGVLTYASATRVIREALITCDDPRRARELRSYWDQTRTLSLLPGRPPAIHLAFSSNDPGKPPVVVELTAGIAGDDLDVAHAKPPAGLRVAAWRR
ncbi:MAG TPA: hypothetical protein VL285_17135 [Bryobacteraceae bacterium]|nr:hypothetical protein [Bryobacteraceae bacterium]